MSLPIAATQFEAVKEFFGNSIGAMWAIALSMASIIGVGTAAIRLYRRFGSVIEPLLLFADQHSPTMRLLMLNQKVILARQRAMANAMPGIRDFGADLSGRWTEVTDALQKFFSVNGSFVEESELMGGNWIDFVEKSERADVSTRYYDAIRNGEPVEMDMHLTNGKHVHLTAYPIPDKYSRVEYIGHFRDKKPSADVSD